MGDPVDQSMLSFSVTLLLLLLLHNPANSFSPPSPSCTSSSSSSFLLLLPALPLISTSSFHGCRRRCEDFNCKPKDPKECRSGEVTPGECATYCSEYVNAFPIGECKDVCAGAMGDYCSHSHYIFYPACASDLKCNGPTSDTTMFGGKCVEPSDPSVNPTPTPTPTPTTTQKPAAESCKNMRTNIENLKKKREECLLNHKSAKWRAYQMKEKSKAMEKHQSFLENRLNMCGVTPL